jgi:hypothetical protein
MKTLVLGLVLGCICYAQPPEAKPGERAFFKVDFVVKEIESGKQISARTYSSMMAVGGKSAIRTGDKVQVPTNQPGQFSFSDVSIQIDSWLQRAEPTKVELRVIGTANGYPSPDGASTYYRWESEAIVPIRKPTIIFLSDAVSTKRQAQLEVTVTPVP